MLEFFPVGLYKIPIIVIIVIVLGLFILCGHSFSGWSYFARDLTLAFGLCRKTER